jgi:DNA-binding response OmpR family regulator
MPDTKRVLIIDDDLFISDLYSLELQKAGFVVTTAGSGELGLSKLPLEHPSLVLLDIAMPVMDGITVLSKIRENKDYDSIKVVLLTNIRDEETIRLGLSKGADGYLLKTSLTPEQVGEEVKRMLA